MKRQLVVGLLSALPLVAQPPQEAAGERVQKLVTVKYADPMAVRNLLANFGVEAQVDGQLRVIALTGRRANVVTAEEAIKQLDVPTAAQKDIELTAYFVVGSDQANVAGNAIPQDLQSTVATLKTTFPFRTYALLDVLSLRSRSGSQGRASAESSGQLTGGRFSVFHVRSASIEGDGTSIRLDGLHAGVRIPHVSAGKTDLIDTGISVDVADVKEGQKLVVGRSSLDGPEKALFLVVIAKVIN